MSYIKHMYNRYLLSITAEHYVTLVLGMIVNYLRHVYGAVKSCFISLYLLLTNVQLYSMDLRLAIIINYDLGRYVCPDYISCSYIFEIFLQPNRFRSCGVIDQ